MPDHVISSSQFSSPASSSWALLDEFATIGDRRNATTATALTSAGGTVEVSFEFFDPPVISPWFANFSGLKERFEDYNGGDRGCGWTATVWKREVGSDQYWHKCFEADIADILAKDSRFSHLHCKVWDDEVGKRGLSKVASALPTLSLGGDDVVYLMTKLTSEQPAETFLLPEALLLAVNAREARVEAVEVIPCHTRAVPVLTLR